ncbi:MAG: LysR substrate-binding domain-containing protein, partial [Perlucidibaca sp.]
ELHLTTSAISQQIRQLESLLGLPLFQRLVRRVELTDAGRQFSEVASQTLTAYRQGYAEFAHRFAKPELRLSMTPLIAHEFMLPRVAELQAQHPEVSISIEASMEVVDFDKVPIDAAIRVGGGHWTGLTSWPLCTCEAVMLAAPSLLARQPVNELTDLGHHVLIRRRHEQFGWSDLARLMHIAEVPGKGELVVDSDLAALHAAERGLGIALSFLPAGMTSPALWPEGSLETVLPPVPTPLNAYFVSRANNAKIDLLKDVFAWIQTQITS